MPCIPFLIPGSAMGELRRGLRCSGYALVGFWILGCLAVVAVLAPWISPFPPDERVGKPFEPPSWKHPLGTDDIGQDILSQVIYGSRVSLLLGTLSALMAVSLGAVVGAMSGYFGGHVDRLLMRVVDVVLVVPFLPLAILLAAYLGASLWNLVLVMGALMWARPARVLRARVLAAKERDHVLAAKALGGGPWHILRYHILPTLLPLCFVQFILVASTAILVEASLSFLGLGDPLQKSWGTVLYYAQSRGAMLTGAWVWWILPPGFLITVTVLGFVFAGRVLEEVANPRLRI